MNKAILTLPMMPVDGSNYGKYVTPIVCETLKKIYSCKYYHCVNILDSFNDREKNKNEYIMSLNNNNIHYDYIWYDNENIDMLIENINLLIKKGYIRELNSNVFRCSCGIVEIEENKILSCNKNNLKFEYINNLMFCKYCHSECKKYNEKILAFTPNDINLEEIKFLPGYLNKDAKTYDKTVINSYTTISRKRDTGIKLKFNNNTYNIDIDFLWATYLANFKEEQKIIVSGNRMLYQLFLVGVVEKCLNKNSNTILLGTPYITNIKNIINEEKFINEEIFRKLTILFNLKWSKKERNYDETILSYLKNIDIEKRKEIYDIICTQVDSQKNFFETTNDILNNQFNMQKCINKMKLERRKVYV